MTLKTDLFDYFLPEHLVAQTPATRRDQSRLLVVDRATQSLRHCLFSELSSFLLKGDTLFRNTASVLPARLHGRKSTGGEVECFLLRHIPDQEGQVWRCLLRPGRRLPVGALFTEHEGAFSAEVIGKCEDGSATVRFKTRHDEPLEFLARRIGTVPLPPYIVRKRPAETRALDLERYQTVYADSTRPVAVAAPTAGLHFTEELLAQLQGSGVLFADLTLHVGLGTFKPISTEMICEHEIHRERYEVPVQAQQALFSPQGRRIAVGTTSVRTIEDFLAKNAAPLGSPFQGEAALFIHPPRRFAGVDVLITNFHQPRSTLLCLVAAFLSPGKEDGIAWLREIYAEAISLEYRFFSYGDAMLIL